MTSDRQYEIIVWGATGFTGQLTCQYLSENYPAVSWAMAGRNKEKLLELKKELKIAEKVPVLTADINKNETLDAIFKQTKVVLTTAGPYTVLGTNVLKSCIRVQAHYCDLTAELPWIRKMIDESHEEAVKQRVKIVNCAGFDCIPSDIGCQMIVDEMEKKGLTPVEVRMTVDKVVGGASGGTIASAMEIMMAPIPTLLQMLNPFYLNRRTTNGDLDHTSNKAVIRASSDCMFIEYDRLEKAWTAPYFMQFPNLRIVNRSNSLMNFKYGRQFVYSERMKMPFILGLGTSIIMPIVGTLLFFPFTRALLKLFLPKAGQGPSEDMLNNGYFKMLFWGKGVPVDKPDAEPVIVRGGLNCLLGDPGYKATAVMIAESALCLALDEDKNPKQFGILTPASAMGSSIKDRLQNRGMEFYIKK